MAPRVVTRREVLDLAAPLFAAHGYRSTNLGLVSERLGVTRQALYYHFKSKGEILGALFEEMMTKLESAVAAVPEDPQGGGQRFAELLRAHIDVAVANPELVALLLHERPEIAKLKHLRAAKRRREYARLFIDAYERDVAERPRRIDSWTAVNTLLSAANGVSWWYHGEGTSIGASSARKLGEDLFVLLSRGFLAPAADVDPPVKAVRAPRAEAA